MAANRRDVTEAELRLCSRLCPDCRGQFHWPWIRCGQDEPLEREVGTDDGVVEYVRECPGEGRGPK